MRSYNQYCALARALDVVGDRWSLLVVRELLSRPCRYGELQEGLPGIATNLLSERLRTLEQSGVVTHDGGGRYLLTPWGERLASPVRELARWAAPLMRSQKEGEEFRSHWLAVPVQMMFGGHDAGRPPLSAEIRTGDEIVSLESSGGRVQFRRGPSPSPELVLSGPPDVIVGVLAGRLDKKAASSMGLTVLGDLRKLARLRHRDWLSGSDPSPAPASSGGGDAFTSSAPGR